MLLNLLKAIFRLNIHKTIIMLLRSTSDTHRRKIRQELVHHANESPHTVEAEEKEELDDRTMVVTARGGREWYIVVDTPGGHCDAPLTIVQGIEREYEDDESDDDEGDETVRMPFTGNSAQFLKVTQMLMANKKGSQRDQQTEGQPSTALPPVVKVTMAQLMGGEDSDPDLIIPAFGPLPEEPSPIVEEHPDPDVRSGRIARRRSTLEGSEIDNLVSILGDGADDEDEGSLLEGFGVRRRRKSRPGVRKFFKKTFGGRKKRENNLTFIIDDDVGHGSMMFDAKSMEK